MTEAGMQHITKNLLSRKPETKTPQELLSVPAFIKKAFAAHKGVLEYFTGLAPSHRKNYIAWISAAKKEETRDKRISEAIFLLKHKKPLGLK